MAPSAAQGVDRAWALLSSLPWGGGITLYPIIQTVSPPADWEIIIARISADSLEKTVKLRIYPHLFFDSSWIHYLSTL